ncbi:hypothetical protein CLAIMM_11159 isoform 2 [Cladophialophora immunda]|nr:hypothetical protein CLAIMM_11159 isoform 2 [Cladophialophora immunda]
MDVSFTPNNPDWVYLGLTADDLDMMMPKYPLKDSIPHIHYLDPDVGAAPTVQTFYEGPPKCRCCSNWIEKAPVQVPEAAKERYDEACIRVFKTKDHDTHSARIGGLAAVKNDIIEVQGKVLVNFLRPILAEVGFIPPLKTKITFTAPFRELYFAHRKIVQAAAALDAISDVSRHVGVLVATIEEIFADTVKQVTDLLSRQSITFEYLWTLFAMHSTVYLKESLGNRVYEVTRTEYIDTKVLYGERDVSERTSKPDVFEVEFRNFMFDGTNFGVTHDSQYIPKFKGVRRITSLEVYPLAYHSNPNIAHDCYFRGEKILDLQDMVYCSYNGPATTISVGESSTRHVNERVIVDPYGARKFMSEGGADHADAEEPEEMLQTEGSQGNREQTKASLPRLHRRSRRPNKAEQARNRDFLQAKPEHLVTMNPNIEAYLLSTNEWIKCNLEYFEPIEWNARAFDYLVLDKDVKDMLKTSVDLHNEGSRRDDGLIAGKGDGLIVLLSGLTGTGKTLTVEAGMLCYGTVRLLVLDLPR